MHFKDLRLTRRQTEQRDTKSVLSPGLLSRRVTPTRGRLLSDQAPA